MTCPYTSLRKCTTGFGSRLKKYSTYVWAGLVLNQWRAFVWLRVTSMERLIGSRNSYKEHKVTPYTEKLTLYQRIWIYFLLTHYPRHAATKGQHFRYHLWNFLDRFKIKRRKSHSNSQAKCRHARTLTCISSGGGDGVSTKDMYSMWWEMRISRWRTLP